ncbi:hypothetical protein R1flu_016885 [Riccia fluitans]|uniref:Uncharacterized protein n=1 Tax=Riccia fluitans TaxID=41844 RepID=A0ABD1YR75_9MARC
MARIFSYTCRGNVSGLVHDLGVPSATLEWKPDGHNNACTYVRRFDFCALGCSCVNGLVYLRAASKKKESAELIWYVRVLVRGLGSITSRGFLKDLRGQAHPPTNAGGIEALCNVVILTLRSASASSNHSTRDFDPVRAPGGSFIASRRSGFALWLVGPIHYCLARWGGSFCCVSSALVPYTLVPPYLGRSIRTGFLDLCQLCDPSVAGGVLGSNQSPHRCFLSILSRTSLASSIDASFAISFIAESLSVR